MMRSPSTSCSSVSVTCLRRILDHAEYALFIRACTRIDSVCVRRIGSAFSAARILAAASSSSELYSACTCCSELESLRNACGLETAKQSSSSSVLKYHIPSRCASGMNTSSVCCVKTSRRCSSARHSAASPPHRWKAAHAAPLSSAHALKQPSAQSERRGAAASSLTPSCWPTIAPYSSRIETRRDASAIAIERGSSQPASMIWHCRSSCSARLAPSSPPSSATPAPAPPSAPSAARSSRAERRHTVETPPPISSMAAAASSPRMAVKSCAATPTSASRKPASIAASMTSPSALIAARTRLTARW
mmetsp:Transcript_49473/g.159921  ORF Transcript_49473/g.159921 Transcript_49473/m.159921 type:complete len:305 (+) Transcript_49473:436-1350(+)